MPLEHNTKTIFFWLRKKNALSALICPVVDIHKYMNSAAHVRAAVWLRMCCALLLA